MALISGSLYADLPVSEQFVNLRTLILALGKQTKSHRWKYWAPRELEPNEVK